MTEEEQNEANESLREQDAVVVLNLQRGSFLGLDEAVDECQREMDLRTRCYPKWLGEGRISKTDARDRLARLESAVQILKTLQAAVRQLPF